MLFVDHLSSSHCQNAYVYGERARATVTSLEGSSHIDVKRLDGFEAKSSHRAISFEMLINAGNHSKIYA